MNRYRTVGPETPVQCIKCGMCSDRRRDWVTQDFAPCKCGGEMRRRPSTLKLRADARAKRELAEQDHGNQNHV